MQEENDILLRQIKAFAQGLAYLLGKGSGGSNTEIVFPQKQSDSLPYQDQLESFISNGKLHEATSFLFSRRFAMEESSFVRLALWYFENINHLTDFQLSQDNYSRNEIQLGLTQISKIQKGDI